MRTNKQKLLSRADGYITIDIPPIPFPTPVTAARWFATNPVMRALYFVVIGIGIGHFWHSPQALPTIFPPPVITVTETLEEFAARESEALTADERRKLITVTEKVLSEHFGAPSAMRETFYNQRLLAGVDSPAFNAFSEKWAVKAEEKNLELGDGVETMRSIYESLLRGLKVQAYSDREVETEEKPPPVDADSSDILSPPSSSTEVRQTTVQRQRLFRR